MIVMNGVNGTPHSDGPRRPRADLDPMPYYEDDTPEQEPTPARPALPGGDDWDDDDDRDGDGQPDPPAGLWQAFTDWIDRYAWSIIVLGIALILFDVLLVLTMLIYQVSR